MRDRSLILLTVGLGLIWGGSAKGLLLPPSRFSMTGGENTVVQGPGSVSYDYSDADTELVFTVLTTAGNKPMVDVQANLRTSLALGGGGGGVGGSAVYYYGVDGDAELASEVPVLIHVSGAVSASGTGRATASVETVPMGTRLGNPFARVVAGYGGSPASDDFEMVFKEYVQVGRVHLVTMSAGGEFIGQGSGSFQAVVDPFIEIDPSFEFADQFTLSVSQVIPEPSSAGVVMVVGGVLVGRRRQSV